MANQIAVVGAGVMGEAFIAALIRSGAASSSCLHVYIPFGSAKFPPYAC